MLTGQEIQELDAACPRGPWKSDQEGLASIQIFTRNPEIGGCGWGIRFQACIEGSKRRIGCCHAHGENRSGAGISKLKNGSNCR